MAQTTIEWTHQCKPDGTIIPGYTFNIVHGCQKVSEGCRYCYAEAITKRFGQSFWGPTAPRKVMSEVYWSAPVRWNREAGAEGHSRLVFCSSMADVFEEHPTVSQERKRLWPLIEQTPWLIWLLLTKRPENILRMAPYSYGDWPRNIWVGTSVENQARADERIPYLLDVPVRVCFLSCEPLVEFLDLSSYLSYLQWVIVGGESGPHARPMEPEWAHFLCDQCVQAGVPFFFKQWGGRHHSSGGRLLDRRTWDEMPVPDQY